MGAIQQVLLGYGATGGGGGDPYFASVSSLLHMDGTNGSSTFTDVKGKTWTRSGSAQISTAQSKFGGASGLFAGGSDNVISSAHADFGFGTGDFTIEVWVRPTASAQQCFFDNRSGSNTGIGIYSYVSGVGGNWGWADNGAVVGTGSVLSLNTWVFLVLCRESGTMRAYRDGVQQATATDSRTYAASPVPIIGMNYVGSEQFTGNVDDVRITKGVCRYPGGTTFTPPTAAFPDS